MDDIDLIVETACRLPTDYKQFGDRSAVDLIRRSGLVGRLEELTLERIRACLAKHPEWIDAWIQWSEDNRGTPAWYILGRSRDVPFEVAYLDSSDTVRRSEKFADRTQACAVFVGHELRDIVASAGP